MPSSPPSDLGLAAKSIAFHPTEAELREYADAMPQARQTEYGNVNVQTRVVSRSKARLLIEKANANIAAMQRFLYYDPVEVFFFNDTATTEIYTPNLAVPG